MELGSTLTSKITEFGWLTSHILIFIGGEIKYRKLKNLGRIYGSPFKFYATNTGICLNFYLTRVKNLFKNVFRNSLCEMFIAYSLWK